VIPPAPKRPSEHCSPLARPRSELVDCTGPSVGSPNRCGLAACSIHWRSLLPGPIGPLGVVAYLPSHVRRIARQIGCRLAITLVIDLDIMSRPHRGHVGVPNGTAYVEPPVTIVHWLVRPAARWGWFRHWPITRHFPRALRPVLPCGMSSRVSTQETLALTRLSPPAVQALLTRKPESIRTELFGFAAA
jgi:hypothetical protein